MRSGYVNLSDPTSRFVTAGLHGLYWSSRGSGTRYDGTSVLSAYYLNFDATVTRPSSSPNHRWFGHPLRCLSTVLDIIE